MADHPKILVGSPTSSLKEYCLWKFLAWIQCFTYPNYDIFISDNSYDTKLFKLINKIVTCGHVPPAGKQIQEALRDSQNQIRQKAIRGGYEWLFMVECDIFLPLNIIEHLLSHKTKIVGVPYYIYLGEESKPMVTEMEEWGLEKKDWQWDFMDGAIIADGKLKKVFNTGLGATLIHRSVFEKIQFRVDVEAGAACADSFFALDLHKRNIPVYTDTSLIARHENQGWHFIPNQ